MLVKSFFFLQLGRVSAMHEELHPVTPAAVHAAGLHAPVGAIGIGHTLLNQLIVQGLVCREGIVGILL